MEHWLLDRRRSVAADAAELLAAVPFFSISGTDPVHKISIVPRGIGALGYTLQRATDIARDMITRFGMDEGLGYVAFEAQRPGFLDAPELVQGGCRVAESTQTRIDQAIAGAITSSVSQGATS